MATRFVYPAYDMIQCMTPSDRQLSKATLYSTVLCRSSLELGRLRQTDTALDPAKHESTLAGVVHAEVSKVPSDNSLHS
jgi:hypothetical protein